MEGLKDILREVRNGQLSDRDAADRILASLSNGERRRTGARRRNRAREFRVDGHDYTCEGNRLNVSRVKGLELVESTFSENRLNASSIGRVSAERSEISDCRWNGSRLADGDLTGSVMKGVHFSGSSVTDLRMVKGELRESRFNGVHVKNLRIAARVQGARVNGSHLEGWSIDDGAEVVDLRANGTRATTCKIASSRVVDVRFSGASVRDLAIVGSTLEECDFRSREMVRLDGRAIAELLRAVKEGGDPPAFLDLGLKRARGVTLHDVCFEEMQVRRCQFVDCRLRNVRLEGFEIEDLEIRDLTLEDCEISSREEWMDLVSGHIVRERDDE